MLDLIPKELILEIMSHCQWDGKKALSVSAKKYYFIFKILTQNHFQALPPALSFKIFGFLRPQELNKFACTSYHNKKTIRDFKQLLDQIKNLNLILNKYRNYEGYHRTSLYKNGKEMIEKKYLTIQQITKLHKQKIFLLLSHKALKGINEGYFSVDQISQLHIQALKILLDRMDHICLRPEHIETYIQKFSEKVQKFTQDISEEVIAFFKKIEIQEDAISKPTETVPILIKIC